MLGTKTYGDRAVYAKGEEVNIMQGCLPLKVSLPAQKLPTLIILTIAYLNMTFLCERQQKRK